MMQGLPLWMEAVIAVLVVAGGLLSLTGAVGLVRLKDFFQRIHPTALALTLGAWCVSLASVLFFSMLGGAPALRAIAVVVLLSITVPVTTLLLARAGLFRRRQAGEPAPPSLG